MLAKSALNYALSSSPYATNEPQIAVLNNNRLDFLGLCAGNGYQSQI
jgi:dsRNA-specific ribonuclease